MLDQPATAYTNQQKHSHFPTIPNISPSPVNVPALRGAVACQERVVSPIPGGPEPGTDRRAADERQTPPVCPQRPPSAPTARASIVTEGMRAGEGRGGMVGR